MTIQYFGKNIEEGRINPEAYITYDENKEKDKVDKVFEILESYGYEIFQEEECAVIPVDGKYEYSNLVSDYKEAKKKAK